MARRHVITLAMLIVWVTTLGCSSRTISVRPSASRGNPDGPSPRASGNYFFKWIGVMPGAKLALLVPGLPRGFVTGPVYELNTITGRVKALRSPWVGVDDAVVSQANNVAALSVSDVSGASPSSSIWLYQPERHVDQQLKRVKAGTLFGLLVSPSNDLVGAYMVTQVDLDRLVAWRAARLRGGRHSPQPRVRPIPYVLNLASKKLMRIPRDGTPLCWRSDGQALYLRSNGIVAYDVLTRAVSVVSPQCDIEYARWLPTTSTFLVARAGKSGTGPGNDRCAFPADQGGWPIRQHSGTRDLARRRHVAYRRQDLSFAVDLKTGRESRVGTLTGDMGPAWVDGDTISVGDSDGTFHQISLDGSIKASYNIGLSKLRQY